MITGLPFLCGAAGALLSGRLSDLLVRRTGSRRWGRSLLGLGGFTAAGLCVDALRWRLSFAGLSVSWFVAAAWLLIDAGKPMFREQDR